MVYNSISTVTINHIPGAGISKTVSEALHMKSLPSVTNLRTVPCYCPHCPSDCHHQACILEVLLREVSLEFLLAMLNHHVGVEHEHVDEVVLDRPSW